MGGLARRSERGLDALARTTARLASTTCAVDVSGAVARELAALNFGAVYVASYDEAGGYLHPLVFLVDGADATRELPGALSFESQHILSLAFRERRLINIRDPAATGAGSGASPASCSAAAASRTVREAVWGRPFACGPLLGRRGQPVGAIGLSRYRGGEPIPDGALCDRLLQALLEQLVLAIERADDVDRLDRLRAELARFREAAVREARVKTVGELASTVAHDLNNVTSVALMAASVGQRSSSDPVDALSRLERACRAIGQLVTRLQRVARASQEEPDLKPVDVAQIAEDVAVMVTPLCRDDAIAVESDIRDRPRALGEPGALEHILTNLLLNAREALVTGRRDGRRVSVTVRQGDEVVEIVVEDTGPGIPDDLLARIFEPLVTTKDEKHAGLGLATIRSAVDRMGGEIRARNGGGGGARFDVRLPAAPEDAEPPAEAEGESAPARGPDADAAGAEPYARPDATWREILVVEDDADIVEILIEYLRPLGYRVACARDADRALAEVESRPFDLVLCDISIPGCIGTELLGELRRRGCRAGFVLMTAWHDRLHGAWPSEGAPEAILPKPFTADDLGEALDRASAEAPRGRAPEDDDSPRRLEPEEPAKG